jgi:hypothetical protein
MLRLMAVFALAALTLAGCGAVSASTPTASVATPSLPCSLPYGTHVALLSPAPGSTGVTPGASVIVAASRELPKTVTVVAIDRKGGATVSAILERTTPPAHAQPAPFPGTVYYRAGGVGLRPHHTYTVALDDVAQNGCAPYVAIAGNAHFST